MGSRNDDLQANSIASSFAAAVNGAGGLLTGSEYNALLGLTSDLISYNLLGKMKAIYPVVSSQRNLASYTEASTVGYTVQGVSLTSTTQTSPVNSSTAVRVSFVTGVNPFCYQSHTLPANTQYVFSVYLRAVSGTPTLQLNINHSNGGGDAAQKYVTLSTTWQRYELPFNTAAFSNNFFTVIKQVFVDIEFWGWQLEPGSTATAYQSTLGLADDVFKNSFKFNLANPARFSGSFTSGWTFSPTGMTPNGTSAYMDTNFNVNTEQESNQNFAFGFYSGTVGGANSNNCSFGGYDGSSETDILIKWGDSYTYLNINQTVYTNTFINADTHGFYVGNRNTVGRQQGWKNGVLIFDIVNSPTSKTAVNLYIGARNQTPSPVHYDNKRCQFTFAGNGLSNTDAFLLYLAVQRYQTLLNRQV